MKIVNSIKDLKAYLAEAKQDNKKIGFVPTMGALHNGHLSLVQHCVKNNDVCVVSVFVNPTQFNDKHDLETYPRTLEADCVLLESAGCDYVFAPSVEEMYPEPDTRTFDLGTVSEVMEGAKRPGHFNGVAQVVSKLFYIVEPDNAYFGEKDTDDCGQCDVCISVKRRSDFNMQKNLVAEARQKILELLSDGEFHPVVELNELLLNRDVLDEAVRYMVAEEEIETELGRLKINRPTK
mgnify:CR=1 FL=1